MAELYAKSPTQATDVYGLNTSSVPRKKSLFYVRFRRADTSQANQSGWSNNLGFMVKSIDRPSVTPVVEELNQYGKKRLITTGYKHQPMRIVLHDTSDSLAMRMWVEYSRWYFGDYRQGNDDYWRYDITLPGFYDSSDGFGFSPREVADESLDLNSQYFFDVIEVYQVWGGYFTQFDIVNPRITAFDPDELDYSVTEASTINVQVSYEVIQHRYDAVAQPISMNEGLAAVFNTKFNGGTFDIGTVTPRNGYPSSVDIASAGLIRTPAVPAPAQKTLADAINKALGIQKTNNTSGGALGMFGNFSFGSIMSGAGINTGSLAGDISYLATGNPSVASILNMPSSGATSLATSILSGNSGFSTAINGSKLDAAQGALLSAATKNATNYAKNFVTKNLLPGVMATAAVEKTAPTDTFTSTNDGLILGDSALGITNAARSSTSQYGVNQNTINSLLPKTNFT